MAKKDFQIYGKICRNSMGMAYMNDHHLFYIVLYIFFFEKRHTHNSHFDGKKYIGPNSPLSVQFNQINGLCYRIVADIDITDDDNNVRAK